MQRIDLEATLLLLSMLIVWGIIASNLPLSDEWQIVLSVVGGGVIGFVASWMGIQIYRFRED